MNTIIQTLQNCGLQVEPGSTPSEVTSVLMKAEEDDLWKAFNRICDGNPIGFKGEDAVQKVTVAYALAYAVENDLDSINQEAVDAAREKAVELVESLKPEESSKKITRTRTPELRGEMLQYIKDNPKMTKQEVVNAFQSLYPEKAETTLGQYYHGCRKEAGLNPNGTPGRKKGDTMELVRNIVAEMIAKNPDIEVPELKDAVLNHPSINLSPSSVQVYVYRARSDIKGN